MCVQEKRLNRVFGLRFGDHAYGFEELVAEMDSAFLCARIGLKGVRSRFGKNSTATAKVSG